MFVNPVIVMFRSNVYIVCFLFSLSHHPIIKVVEMSGSNFVAPTDSKMDAEAASMDDVDDGAVEGHIQEWVNLLCESRPWHVFWDRPVFERDFFAMCLRVKHVFHILY